MPIYDFGSPKKELPKEHKELPKKEISLSPKRENPHQNQNKNKENKENKENNRKPPRENKIKVSHPLIHGLLNIEEEEL